jgi:hypothetical protein
VSAVNLSVHTVESLEHPDDPDTSQPSKVESASGCATIVRVVPAGSVSASDPRHVSQPLV